MHTITDAEYNAFLVVNQRKFLDNFRNFEDLGGNFKPTWVWPALFAGFWWFLYRKMYLAAAVLFITGLIPYVNIVTWIAAPIAAKFLYYKSFRKKYDMLRARHPEGDIRAQLMELGGTHPWVVWVGMLLSLGFFMLGVMVALQH